jgi:hypothetical protein
MYFYNATTKVYIIAFSKLFSGLHVKRYDSDDNETKDIKVPLVYATKNKISYELQKNPDSSTASIVLPVIGFNIDGLSFAPQRKLSSLNSMTVDTEQSMYEGVPYDYQFTVNIRTKYQDDLWQILEQVLYLFKPDISLDVKELSYPDYSRDVQVVLNSTSFENELELTQEPESQRGFIATLDLTLKGFVYPSVMNDTLIEHIDVNLNNELDKLMVNISHDWIPPDIVTTITEYD